MTERRSGGRRIAAWLAAGVIRARRVVMLSLLLASLLAVVGLQHLMLGAGYDETMPQHHPFIETQRNYAAGFGKGNHLLIAVRPADGRVFSADFLPRLEAISNAVFLLPGIDRSRVNSLFTPNVRYTEIVEDGFKGGTVVPRDFRPTPQMVARVRHNALRSAQARRLLSQDLDATLIRAELLETDPASGRRLDYRRVAEQLKSQLQDRFGPAGIRFHIIGYAPFMAELVASMERSAWLFPLTLLITLGLLFLALGSLRLALMPMLAGIAAVLWLLGLMGWLGWPLHPFGLLMPFLVFAIGVSHGVQLMRAWQARLGAGDNSRLAAGRTLERLLGVGLLALLSDGLGFVTVLWMDIPVVREMGLIAALGIALLIVSNLLLLPALLATQRHPAWRRHPLAAAWLARLRHGIVRVTRPAAAVLVVTGAVCLLILALGPASRLQVGHAQAGVPELAAESRYNRDLAFITGAFAAGSDELVLYAQGGADACIDFRVMDHIDRLVAMLQTRPEVLSVRALTESAKAINAGWHEGNLKWATLPRHPAALGESVAPVETTSGLLNHDCSIMPIYIQAIDHRNETIQSLLEAVRDQQARAPLAELDIRLAGGNLGVQAAINQEVAAAQLPILATIYSLVFLMCLLGFRSLRAALCIVSPLALVSVLSYALMAWLGIGLTPATQPVVALGAGIGVDYGIYLYGYLRDALAREGDLRSAFDAALHNSGSAILVTALTLTAGVLPWGWSALQYLADMGWLLAAMFIANMAGALLLLPALFALLNRPAAAHRRGSYE